MKDKPCRTCVHCNQTTKMPAMGDCHLDPPKVFMIPGRTNLGQTSIQKMSGYPPVKLDDDGCGKHEES